MSRSTLTRAERTEAVPDRGTHREPRSGPAYLLTFVICCVGLFGAMRPSPDPDSWWHLATGKWIVENTAIPRTDPFSWTAGGNEWVAHEWGTEIIFNAVDSGFGPVGLLVMQGLLVGAGFFLLRLTLRRLVDNEWIVAAGLAAALFLSSLMWSLRPHLVSLVFVVFFLDALVAYRKGEADRRIWALVPLTIVWANLHAGFLSGVLLVWVFTVVSLLERRNDTRRLLVVAAAITVAGMLNPSGPEIYVFSVYLAQVSRDVSEWSPPGIRDPFGIGVSVLALGIPVLLALTRRGCDRAVLATSFVFGLLGIGAIRNIWLAGILMAPAAALALDGLGLISRPQAAGGDRERRLLMGAHVVVPLLGVLVVTSLLRGQNESYLRGEHAFPKEAAEVVAELPPGRMLNPYNWGGYLIWKLPDVPVSVDGRADLYGYELLEQVQMMERLESGWDRYLDRQEIDYVLWQKERPLAQALRLLDDWSLVYEDDMAVVFQRS
jgi:hypothetical protein